MIRGTSGLGGPVLCYCSVASEEGLGVRRKVLFIMRLRKFVSFTAAVAVALSGLVFAAAPARAATLSDPLADINGANGVDYLDILGVTYTVSGTGAGATFTVSMDLNGNPYKKGTSGPLNSVHWFVEIFKGAAANTATPVAAFGVDGLDNSVYVGDGAVSSQVNLANPFSISGNTMTWSATLAQICDGMVPGAGLCAGGAEAYFAANDLYVLFATGTNNSITSGVKDIAPDNQIPLSYQFLAPPAPANPVVLDPLGTPRANNASYVLTVDKGTTSLGTWREQGNNATTSWTLTPTGNKGTASITAVNCAPSVACAVTLSPGAEFVAGGLAVYQFTLTATIPGAASPTTNFVTVNVNETACTTNCSAPPTIVAAPSIRFEPSSMTVKDGKPVSSAAVVDGKITSYSSIVCTPGTGVTGSLDSKTGLPVISGTPTADGDCTVTAIGPGGSTKAIFYYTVLATLKLQCGAAGSPSTTSGIVPGSAVVTATPADAGGRISVSGLGAGLAKANLESFAGGKLTYQALPGFSGNSSVTLTGSLNGDDVKCVSPVVVLPEPAFGGYYSITGALNTNITWVASQNATGYVVSANGAEICRTNASTVICDVKRLLGPTDQVTIQALGNDGTKSTIIPAGYRPGAWVYAGTINFASGQSTLNAAGVKQAEKILALLQRAGFTNVRAIGNTDGQGGSKGALALSKARVARVTAWMTSRADVTITGEFDANLFPVASNATKAGQAKNRRVDIWVR